MEMRAVFGNYLKQAMKDNERIVVVDADLAKANGTIALRDEFPERAIDVGVAEQNMASVGAGLASYGFIPFITTFTPFATRRICDQVAISIAYAGMNVKIVGTDPGITAELNGGTHMSVEDIGVLRSIPRMVIFEPVDNIQLEQAMPQIIKHNGPVYIRLFRKEIADVFDSEYKFDLFKADVIGAGSDITILASGIMVQESLAAVEMLKQNGVSAELINVHTIKPIDSETIIKSAKKTGCVLTCENHNVIGGLGSAAAEVFSREYPVVMDYIGINDRFGEVGKLDELKKKLGMTADDIVKKATDLINRK